MVSRVGAPTCGWHGVAGVLFQLGPGRAATLEAWVAIHERINEKDVVSEIQEALKTMSLRDASEAIAKAYGLPKREIYQRALMLAKK